MAYACLCQSEPRQTAKNLAQARYSDESVRCDGLWGPSAMQHRDD